MGEHVFRSGIKINGGGAAMISAGGVSIVDVEKDITLVSPAYDPIPDYMLDSVAASECSYVSWQFLILYDDNSSKAGIISATWIDDSGGDLTTSTIIGEATAESVEFSTKISNIEIALNGTDIEFRCDVTSVGNGGVCKMIRTVM